MTTRNGSALTWYSYNLPNQIAQGSNYSQFSYSAGRARYKEVAFVAAGGSLPTGTETTISINGMFEEVTKPSGVVEYKHYIVAGTTPIAIRTLRSNGANDTRYLHKDHLGSVDTITDEAGAAVLRLSYDAFGKRRSVTTWSGTPSSADWTNIAAITHRGFTYHEQLDDVGLVHMNGRIYDPMIGRFISADPTIQAPYMSQSLNRYSYVINNPLSLVDPTGYGFLSDVWDAIVGFVRFAAPIVIAFVAYAYGAPYFSQLLSSVALASGTITAAGAAVAGGLSATLGAALSGAGWRASFRAGIWGAIGSWIGNQVSQGAADSADSEGKLYRVYRGEDGGINADPLTGSPTSSTLFVNGQDCDVKTAAAYALQQSNSTDVTMFYNPTHGLIADTTESTIMKLTGHSSLGDQLAQILQSGDYTAVIGHSQGTLIISNALKTLSEAGFTFDNGLSITYYGSAANQYVARALADSVGATLNGPLNNPFDFVGNVVGLNTLNPFRFVGSILASPSLFLGPSVSPHDCYPACVR